jgi:acyl-coenzyme A thioesterase PaaI-like protein
MNATDSVLTIEYKLNIMAPANGEMLIARGQVLRPGRRVSVAKTDVFSVKDGVETHCATSLGTFMVLPNTPDEPTEAK